MSAKHDTTATPAEVKRNVRAWQKSQAHREQEARETQRQVRLAIINGKGLVRLDEACAWDHVLRTL